MMDQMEFACFIQINLLKRMQIRQSLATWTQGFFHPSDMMRVEIKMFWSE